jgi:hypothetical protein
MLVVVVRGMSTIENTLFSEISTTHPWGQLFHPTSGAVPRREPSRCLPRRDPQPMEEQVMDAHFNEYLAAVEGMQETYGESADRHLLRFHDDSVPATTATVEAEAAAGSHWDV